MTDIFTVQTVHESRNTNKVVVNLVFNDDGSSRFDANGVSNGALRNGVAGSAITTGNAGKNTPFRETDFAGDGNVVINVDDFEPSSMGAVVSAVRLVCAKGSVSRHAFDETQFSLVNSKGAPIFIFPGEDDIDVSFPSPWISSKEDETSNGNVYLKPLITSSRLNQSINVQLVFEKIY